MLVPNRDVQNSTAPGYEKPFVDVGDEEIGVEGREAEADVPHCVGAIY